MKVTGLGTPESVRARFRTAEIDVLVDVLREHRAQATREAATAHETVSTSVRSVHDRLRAVEALLMQLDDQPHTREGVVLFGDTALIGEIVRDGATQALARFVDAHQRYRERARVEAHDRLLTAAVGAQAWVATLVAFDRVNSGWLDDA